MQLSRHNFDWPLIACAVLLTALGISNITSATFNGTGSPEAVRQLCSFAVGCIFFLIFSFADLKFFFRNSVWVYAVLIICLASVIIFGVDVNGARRWISLGPLGSFQPSEAAKLCLVFVMSRCLAGDKDGRYGAPKPTFIRFCLLYLLIGVPAALIMKQPDLGTAIVFGAVGSLMMWTAGYNWKWFAGLICMGAAALPYVLHDYQRERIMIFMNPDIDPSGAGWNIIQAKIAIGSGGFWGKGWMAGSQNRLNFVPEHHTDFIFTVIGEEMGMIGALCLLLLLVCLVWRAWQLAQSASGSYDSFLAFGIGTLFFVHTFVNIGMTSGILPVVGIPLPFVSYGGTSLIVNLSMLGILNNIARHTLSLELGPPESLLPSVSGNISAED